MRYAEMLARLLLELSRVGISEIAFEVPALGVHRMELPDGRLCWIEARPDDVEPPTATGRVAILRPGTEAPLVLELAMNDPALILKSLESSLRSPLYAVPAERADQALAACQRVLAECAQPRPRLRLA